MNNNFLSNALSNYDKIIERSKEYNIVKNDFKDTDTYNNKDKTENNKEILSNYFLTKNNNKLQSNYKIDYIGVYNIIDQIWTWMWIIKNVNIFKIVEWCNNSMTNSINDNMIRAIIMTPKFIIVDDLQLDIILAVVSYIYKNNVIVTEKKDSLIYYYAVKTDI